MEIRQLQYFVAVAENLNFSRAAEILHVTQPTLSAQISDIEGQLGVSLFNRSTRSVHLTAAGKEFYVRAKYLLNDLENLVHATRVAEEVNKEFSHSLTVGIEDCEFSMEHSGLPEAIHSFWKQNPTVNLTCTPLQYKSGPQSVASGEIDVGFFYLRGKEFSDVNLREQCIAKDRIAVAVPRCWDISLDRPETLERFNQATAFFPIQNQHWTSQALAIISRLNVFPRQCSLHNMNTANSYVEMGNGIYFAPKSQLVQQQRDFMSIVDVPEDAARIRISAIFCPEDNNPLVKRLLALLPSLDPD